MLIINQFLDVPPFIRVIIAAIGVLFVILLFISLISSTLKSAFHPKSIFEKPKKRTRQLNSKLGALGFLGFFGFIGIWTYIQNQNVLPFFFFALFGNFSHYFDGKMSNTLMDERFYENWEKAKLSAFQIGFQLILIAFVGGVIGLGHQLEALVIFLIISFSFVVASIQIFEKYLLYRYDNDDMIIEELE